MVTFKPKAITCEEALDFPAPSAPSIPIVHVVAVALVDGDGRILLAQRPEGKAMAGLWEFPGGKVEQDEIPEYALMRELREELGIETRPCTFTPAAYVSHSYAKFHLVMPLFLCRVWRGVPTPQEGQNLKWVYPKDMRSYPMPDADLPLIDQLERAL